MDMNSVTIESSSVWTAGRPKQRMFPRKGPLMGAMAMMGPAITFAIVGCTGVNHGTEVIKATAWATDFGRIDRVCVPVGDTQVCSTSVSRSRPASYMNLARYCYSAGWDYDEYRDRSYSLECSAFDVYPQQQPRGPNGTWWSWGLATANCSSSHDGDELNDALCKGQENDVTLEALVVTGTVVAGLFAFSLLKRYVSQGDYDGALTKLVSVMLGGTSAGCLLASVFIFGLQMHPDNIVAYELDFKGAQWAIEEGSEYRVKGEPYEYGLALGPGFVITCIAAGSNAISLLIAAAVPLPKASERRSSTTRAKSAREPRASELTQSVVEATAV